ncbi:MAG TPA: leucyl/phenylalanyl-tRNA--protein transferase [Thermodesulfovibrionales bacterium]|nr:leucyl/phenylalanyl-tRNA--protein transferase [Thermodesulfovibrionales bacterium]
MTVFQLCNELIFPPPEFSERDGLLAIGGDLRVERLLLAYSKGIFPWYSDNWPILWWSPDPRLILIPEELRVSRSLKQTIRKGFFTATMDRAFEEVIWNCSDVHRKEDDGTWITDDMADAYVALHHAGYAHSIESWHDGKLAGGLYGVSLGSAFFGESMFTKISDASKVAFTRLVRQLKAWNFTLIDCQVTTRHLTSFGARQVLRSRFLAMLTDALQTPTRKGKWDFSL